jgi:DNA mismatch endonuclease (patch repair protein)
MPFKFVTTPQRSKNMAAIRGAGNITTELLFAKILRKQRITGWRRHLELPGKPDFAFPKLKVAIFVDGCFWHFCPRCTKIPKQNVKYWIEKKRRNKSRDRKVTRQLRDKGWRVLRFWEHALVNEPLIAERVKSAIRQSEKA